MPVESQRAVPPFQVLLVEPDPVIQKVFRHYLRDRDCVVDTVASVQSALACMSERSYQLVILEGHLPDGSGRQVAEAARGSERHATVPIVAVSTDDTAANVRVLLASGANLFLVKPVSADQIRRVMDLFLLSRRVDVL